MGHNEKKFNEIFERGLNLLRLDESDDKIKNEFNKALKYKLDSLAISRICYALLQYNRPNLVTYYLDILVKSYPTSAETYLILGLYYFLLDKFDKSSEFFKKSIFFNSKKATLDNNQVLLLVLAKLYTHIFLEKYETALNILNNLSDTSDDDFLVFKSYILYILGKTNEAKNIVNEFLDEDGNSLPTHKQKKCIEDFKMLKQIIDNNINAEAVKYYFKGRIYHRDPFLRNLKVKKAIEYYEKAMEIDPKFKFIESEKKELELYLTP